jgi:hypothetical protein
MLLRSGERTGLYTIPVSLFVLVVLLCIAAETHAARRLHLYAGGGVSFTTNDANLVELGPRSFAHGRLAVGTDINKSNDPDRLEFLCESTIMKDDFLYGAGFKLNFDSPGRAINYYLAGLAGPPIEQKGWFAFQVGIELYGISFINVGFIGRRSRDLAIIPITVGIRL